MKLYILQSLYTSDPHEPSETKVYGVYSSQDILLDSFIQWVDEQVKTVIQGVRDFHKEITDGEYQHWQEWRKVNANKLTEAVEAYCDKQREALFEEDIESIFKKLKEFNVNDWCRQMDHLDCSWFPERRFAKIFDFMYMDDFFVTEVEIGQKLIDMKKPFLLILGDNYYPGSRTMNWKRCFETREEAWSQIVVHEPCPAKGIFSHEVYEFEGVEYDWIDIVDLRDWTE